jgi:hypothetical protein
MAFCPFIKVKIGDMSLNPFAYALTQQAGTFVEEQWDHGVPAASTVPIILQVLALEKSGNSDTAAFEVFPGRIYVTDSRVVVVSDTILADNQIFIGHVRYEWVHEVGYQKKSGNHHNQIFLSYGDEDGTSYFVQIIIKRKTDVETIANDILRRIGRYRLAMTNKRQDQANARLQRYADGEKIIPNGDPKKKTVTATVPGVCIAPSGKEFRPVN